MKYFSKEILVSTKKEFEFIDITKQVESIVRESNVRYGMVNIFSTHTTTGVKVNERCDQLQIDMEGFLKQMVLGNIQYKHNENTIDGRMNAHSHLMALITGGSETIPINESKMAIGSWQTIFFIEFDGPREARKIRVTVLGE